MNQPERGYGEFSNPLGRALVVLGIAVALWPGLSYALADETWPFVVEVARVADRQGRPRPPAEAHLWIPPG